MSSIPACSAGSQEGRAEGSNTKPPGHGPKRISMRVAVHMVDARQAVRAPAIQPDGLIPSGLGRGQCDCLPVSKSTCFPLKRQRFTSAPAGEQEEADRPGNERIAHAIQHRPECLNFRRRQAHGRAVARGSSRIRRAGLLFGVRYSQSSKVLNSLDRNATVRLRCTGPRLATASSIS